MPEEQRLNLLFRLYGLPGCVHCEWAYRKLMTASLPPNSVHVVSWEGDPVITDGLKSLEKKRPEEGPDFPALVSFMTGEIIIGEKEGDYDRLIELVRTSVRTVSSDPIATESRNLETSTGAPGTPGAPNVVPVAVSSVPGNVVSAGSASDAQPV